MAEMEPTAAIQRSSRDLGQLCARLQAWLASRLPEGASPAVSDVESTSATGMSSETMLFHASWTESGEARNERLVARLAPDSADVPVFPSYDMRRQFEVIRLVGEKTSVPVPRVWWHEGDTSHLGTEFFVMERIDGQVPPDVMPYNFGDSWLFHANKEDQARLQDSTVGVLAGLHAAERPEETFAFLEFPEAGDTHLRRHIAHAWSWYEFACAGDGIRSPLVERGFKWLDDHWPRDEGTTVLSWGDSRIGNVLYRDFEPVAVLDWEMAGLAPREVDLAWCVYAHRVFEDAATRYGFPGMPHFLRPDDVAGTYEKLTGHTPRDLDFYTAYAAVQWGIVGLRTGRRQVHFGEREMPDDIDELLLNRESLEGMLAAS